MTKTERKEREGKMKIEKLTPEQEAMIPTARDEFLRVGLSTEPADFDAAEDAIKDAYAVAGLAAPKIFIRLASPHEGVIGAAILKGTKFGKEVGAQVGAQVWAQVGAQVGAQVLAQVRDQVRDQVWAQVGDQVLAQVRAQVLAQVGDQVLAQVRDQVGAQVWAQVGAQVGAQVLAQVRDQVLAQVRDQVGAQVWDQVGDQVGVAFYSQHDADFLSFYSFFANAVGLDCAKRFEPLTRVAKSCGWVWFFEGAAIMTDRPKTLRRDEQNRLHCENGPALEYRDGFSIYAWHGTRLPKEWVENRLTIDPAEILKCENVEQRAAGAAMIGWPRMVAKLKRNVIDGNPDSDMGALIELTLPGLREPGRFLQAMCPRNGTIVEGVPRVSDIDGMPIETVIAAQAWRIGDPQSEYIHPTVRT
jgi:hypothetical protein